MTKTASAILLIGWLLLQGCEAPEKDPEAWLRDGKLSFRLPDLAGNIVSDDDPRFRDKVVLLDAWGTWCPPCREMTPFLKDLHTRFAAEGLEIVAVAFELSPDDGGEDPTSLVSAYVADNDIRYLNLYAGAHEHPSVLAFTQLSFLQFDGFPTVVILARDGTVRWIEQGFDKGKAKRMKALVENLLSPPG